MKVFSRKVCQHVFLLSSVWVVGIAISARSAHALDPVTVFIGGYLGGKVIDEVFDPATGKPDPRLLERRLRELEVNSALRADIQAEIAKLRQRVNESTTRQEFLELVRQVSSDIATIKSRLDSVEQRVELLEVQLQDSREGTKNASSAEHFATRAREFFGKQDFHRAIANCNIAIALDEQHAAAYFRRGQAYWNLQAPAELVAIDHSEAIRLKPDYADAYYCRASQWERTGDLQKAREDAQQAVNLVPTDHEYLLSLGIFCIQLGDHPAAIQHLSVAMQHAPPDAARDCQAYRAIAHAHRGELTETEADVNQILSADPACRMGLLARCYLRYFRADYAGLITAADECLGLHPAEGGAYALRGCARVALEDLNAAVADFEKAISINPGDMQSRKNLDVVRARLAPPEPGVGELHIDGEWNFVAMSNGVKVDWASDRKASISSGVLSIADDKVYWKNIRALPNGRYAAVRVSPGVFSPYEHDVEFSVDIDGTLRHDDSQQPALHRSIFQLVFQPRSLKFEAAFNKKHKRTEP